MSTKNKRIETQHEERERERERERCEYPLTDLDIALPKLDKLEAIDAKKPPLCFGSFEPIFDRSERERESFGIET